MKGQKEVQVLYVGQSLKLPVVVIEGHKRPALLECDWPSHLTLDWTQLHRLQGDSLERMLAKYCQVFQRGIGTIVGYQADIKLKEGAKPVFICCICLTAIVRFRIGKTTKGRYY